MAKESRWLAHPQEAYQWLTAGQQKALQEWADKYAYQPFFYETERFIYAEVKCASDLHARKYFTVCPQEQRVPSNG